MLTLCALDAIADGTSKGFDLPGLRLLAVRRDRQVFVYRNSCPHTGINLEWMPDRFLSYDGAFILCSVHGALFTLDSGHCVFGPCRGRALDALNVLIEQDTVYLPDLSSPD